MNLKTIAADIGNYGETFYVVDSDYRTGVQGWTQSDRTGPLDLYVERNPGRVFYTSGGPVTTNVATDAATVQAAVDACVDFRGDTVFFLPGALSLGAVVTIDVPDLRMTGPRRVDRSRNAVTLTDTIGAHVI